MILRHRDTELLRFEWVTDTRVCVISVNDAARRFLPLAFGDARLTSAEEDLRYPLEDWLVSRSAPVGRHFMRNLMDSLGININAPDYYRKALDFSKGLSLNKDSRFREMFLFDAVIYNVDRHLGNFGYLIDNDTNEIIDVAPIFDNGYGLLPHLDVSEASRENDYYALRNYLREKRPALFFGWMDFPYELTDELKRKLEKVRKFRFKKHRHYNWTDERRGVMSGFLQKRISEICDFGRDADKKSQQSVTVGVINSNENVGVKSASPSDLNSSEQKVAKLILRNAAITEAEIAFQLSITLRQAERIVASLKKKVGLTRRGTDKVGEWCFEMVRELSRE